MEKQSIPTQEENLISKTVNPEKEKRNIFDHIHF